MSAEKEAFQVRELSPWWSSGEDSVLSLSQVRELREWEMYHVIPDHVLCRVRYELSSKEIHPMEK